MTIIEKFLAKIGLLAGAQYSARFVSDNPSHEAVGSDEVLIVGGKEFQKWAYFKCPCGCSKVLTLSLSKNRRPSWDVKVDWLQRPTLNPSVRELKGCSSHYWLRKGKIVWCSDTGLSIESDLS